MYKTIYSEFLFVSICCHFSSNSSHSSSSYSCSACRSVMVCTWLHCRLALKTNLFVKLINQNSEATTRNNGNNRKTCDKRSGSERHTHTKIYSVESLATAYINIKWNKIDLCVTQFKHCMRWCNIGVPIVSVTKMMTVIPFSCIPCAITNRSQNIARNHRKIVHNILLWFLMFFRDFIYLFILGFVFFIVSLSLSLIPHSSSRRSSIN